MFLSLLSAPTVLLLSLLSAPTPPAPMSAPMEPMDSGILTKRSADAEPEAEADAYYYNNYGYNGLASYGAYAAPLVSSYAARPVVSTYGAYAASPYVSTYGAYGLRTLGKRSADAEPEAEADAYYYNNYG